MRLGSTKGYLAAMGALVGMTLSLPGQAQNYAAYRSLSTDRGRPHVDHGIGYNRLMTDHNTPLHGVSLAWDGGSNGNDPAVLPTQAQISSLSSTYGLNCIHVYAEQDNQVIGHNEGLMDQLVDEASAAHMYVIITIGCGSHNGTIQNLGWEQGFWRLYGARYANRTNVIFESKNEPQAQGPANWNSGDWYCQTVLYQTIRSVAPSTFILTCTFQAFDNAGAAEAGIQTMKSQGVDFSNAGVAFHGYQTQSSIDACIGAFQAVGSEPAVLCTEFDPGTTVSTDYNNMLETHFCGWVEFTFLTASNYDLTNFFKPSIGRMGVLWTPDYGTWPANSSTSEPIGSNISFKALFNNQFASADNWGANPLVAKQSVAGTWETFKLMYVGTNTVGLQAAVNGKYVCADNGGASPLIANRTSIGAWETFEWYRLGDGNVALRSWANGKLVCADLNYSPAGTLIANRTDFGTWEEFAVSMH